MDALILLVLAAALVYFAFDLRRVSAKKARETGVTGSVLYSDADHDRPTEQFSCDLPNGVRLVGKPDYILKKEGKIIPLEFKSNRAPDRLYPSHELQVGAYFILIEHHYGKSAAPPYGIVRFADEKEFQVLNTAELRARIIDHAGRMSAILSGAEARREHNTKNKCASCEFFPVCNERLE